MSKRKFRPTSKPTQDPDYPTLEDFDSGRRTFLARLGGALLGAGSIAALASACGSRAVSENGNNNNNNLEVEGGGIAPQPDAGIEVEGGIAPQPDAGIDPEPDGPVMQGGAPMPDARIEVPQGEAPMPDAAIDHGEAGVAPQPDAMLAGVAPQPDLGPSPGYAPSPDAAVDATECPNP